ncbi:MAG: AbrB family transcriptional regulator, partial [Erysipelotrichaceae bacterium]|nr:AbrB family transcriptional regulator [Erysipelotrichaceae bacterium]
VGIIGWQIAKLLKLPAPGMLGSMILVGITNIFFDYAAFITPVKVFGTALSGAYIGMQIQRKDITNFRYLFKPFLILIALLTANTFVTGAVIHFVSGIDWLTALISCVAGGVTDMSIVAMDMNADASMVAMLQTVRLVVVLLAFPYWITWLTRNEGAAEEDDRLVLENENQKSFLNTLIHTKTQKFIFTLIVSMIFGYVGLWSKIPAASMMVPMFVIMGLNITTGSCIVTKTEKLIAQILAGSVVGCSIKAETFSSLSTTLVPAAILLLSYFLINFFFSMYCKKKNLLDLKSALFASAPGGATDMTLIAADLGADLTKIALIQSLRAAYVVSVLPLMISLFMKFVS